MAQSVLQLKRVLSPELARRRTKPLIIVVMGVSGSGKTTVAALLAGLLGCHFQGGDDLHPRENVEKMRARYAADRRGPSALAAQDRRGHRRLTGAGRMRRADLLGAKAILPGHHHRRPPRRGPRLPQRIARSDSPRMAARHEHFMPVALLDSQFATLEEPTPDEDPIIVDVGGKPAEIAQEIVRQLAARQDALPAARGISEFAIVEAARCARGWRGRRDR